MTEFEARSRWSMAVRCSRMAAYGLVGTPPDEEPDDTTRGYWRRGKQLEADVAASFGAQYGADDLILQKPIPWPGGIAHGDIYVRSEHLAVEVKSTASKTPLEHQLVQLAGQVHFDPDAERGALILVNPSNLARRVLPMPAVPDELVDQVEAIADQVARASSGQLPERVCSRPSDAMSRMCPFAGTCFAGWEPPPMEELAADAERLADELLQLDEEMRAAKLDTDEIERRRELVRADLRHLIEPAREYAANGLKVKVTPIAGRVTYDIATALKTGAIAAELVEPFRSEGRGHERWTVKYLEESGEQQDAARTLAGLTMDEDAPF